MDVLRIFDAEGDAIDCDTHADDCVTMDVAKLDYIILTEDNLIEMLDFIDKNRQ